MTLLIYDPNFVQTQNSTYKYITYLLHELQNMTEPKVKTGDEVTLDDGKTWRVRLNGTSVYLTHAKTGETKTMQTTKLLRFMQREEPTTSTLLQSASKSDDSSESGSVEAVTVPRTFLYVACDLYSTERHLKIGMSGSIAATLRTYRRRVPGDAIVLTAECASETVARDLEKLFKRDFATFRIDRSEVYRLRLHEVTRALHKQGYRQQADGVFRKTK